MRLLSQSAVGSGGTGVVKGRRIYDDAVRAAVILICPAPDRIFGQRLKAALPRLVESMQQHNHVDLCPEAKTRVLSAQTAAEFVSRSQHSSSHLCRLEPATARIYGDRPGGSPRRQHVGIIGLQVGGHRRLHRPDRGGAPAGQRADPGADRSGSHLLDDSRRWATGTSHPPHPAARFAPPTRPSPAWTRCPASPARGRWYS